MITEATNFLQQHQSVLTTAAAVHFAHLAWPRLVAIFPYCRDNGGAVGTAKQFLFGKVAVRPATTENHNPS